MSTDDIADDIAGAVEGRSVVTELLETGRRLPDATALRWRQPNGAWAEWTWAQYIQQAAAVASGLRDLGVDRGQRIALLLRNRPEFHAADAGALMTGAVPVSLYNSSSGEQLRHLLDDCAARLVVADDSELLERVLQLREAGGLHHVRTVIVVDDREGIAPADVVAFADLSRAGTVDVDEAAAALQGDDLATVVYTSGTTGEPRGACITHRNVLWAGESLRRALGLTRDDLRGQRVVSYLPMAHVAERLVSHYQAMSCGLEVTTCPELGLIARYLRDVQPEIAFGVPSVWERAPRRIAAVASTNLEARDVREVIGLGAAGVVITGAAPTRPELIAWYRAHGVPMTEIYGLSETTGAVTWEGRPLPGVEVRLDDDGEVLVRGGNVFAGYLGAEGPRDATDAGGWFRTGDVGEFDGDGRLTIVDRKKELIVTPGGKKVSPAGLEAALAASPLIEAAAVTGDGRPYLVALLVLEGAAVNDPAATVGLERVVAEVNARVSPPEKIRRWLVVPDTWPPGSDMVTPTGKLRRRAVEARYAAEIDALYEGGL